MDINDFKVLFARGDLENGRVTPAYGHKRKWVIQADVISSGQIITMTTTKSDSPRLFGSQGIYKAAEYLRIVGFLQVIVDIPDMPEREKIRTEPITDEFLLNPPRQEENKTQSLF